MKVCDLISIMPDTYCEIAINEYDGLQHTGRRYTIPEQMCFHRYNTVFTVTDSNGNTENYRIVRSKQAILGYTDLIKEVI